MILPLAVPAVPADPAPLPDVVVTAFAAAMGGAMVGLACGIPLCWPLAVGGVALMSATAIASSMRHGWHSAWTIVASVAAWQVTATGWAVLAVRDGDTFRWAWQALVLLAIVGHHVVLAATIWLLTRWAVLRMSPRCHLSSVCHAAAFWIAWMTTEVVRQWGWFGNGYGTPGLALLDAPGIQGLVPVVGVQGISFLLVFAWSAATAILLRRRAVDSRPLMAWVAAAALVGVAGASLLPPPSKWTNVHEVSLNVMALEVAPPMKRRELSVIERNAALAQLHAALDEAEPHTTIVTPETFFGEPPSSEGKGVWGHLLARVTQRQVTALVSMPQVARDEDGLGQMNTVQQLAPERRAFYAKEHLVPGSEYLPWASVLRPLYQRVFERVERGELAGGGSLTSSLYVEGTELGVAICHELAFARTVARRAEGAGALLNVSDDSWIPSTLFLAQMVAASRARALETGRPLLRVSRGTPSVLVDHLGVVHAGVLEPRGRWTRFALPTRSGTTPYVRFAGAISAAPITVALGLMGWSALRACRSRTHSTRLATCA